MRSCQPAIPTVVLGKRGSNQNPRGAHRSAALATCRPCQECCSVAEGKKQVPEHVPDFGRNTKRLLRYMNGTPSLPGPLHIAQPVIDWPRSMQVSTSIAQAPRNNRIYRYVRTSQGWV